MLVEVDRACLETLPQPLRSPWYHFRRKVITTSGIRPPFWNFWVKEMSGKVDIYTSEKPYPQNIGIATEIASISVSVAKLLVLPVWGYSFYFLFVPDGVLHSLTVSTQV